MDLEKLRANLLPAGPRSTDPHCHNVTQFPDISELAKNKKMVSKKSLVMTLWMCKWNIV